MSERPTTADVRREDRDTRGGRWTVVVDGHESEMTYSRASPTLIRARPAPDKIHVLTKSRR